MKREDIIRVGLLKMIAEEMSELETSKADERNHLRSEIICNLSAAYANLEDVSE